LSTGLVEQEDSTIDSPRISVVICTRNRADKIGAAVESVLANDHPSFDLTIIDQSDTEATKKEIDTVAAGDPRVFYHHVDEPGLSRAYNSGIRDSAGSLIAFTDDDCIAPKDWLERVEAAFDGDPDADLLYGPVVAKPTIASEGAVTPTLEIPRAERLSRRNGFRVIGMGANFAARRRLFGVVGGFDEILGGGGPLRSSQDFDLAYRTYRAGSVIILRPEVVMVHDGLREAEDWPAVLRNYGIGDGAFYSKHVRCGDMYALFLLIRQIYRHASRHLVKTVLRRRGPTDYLSGIFIGVRDGFKFRIDRRHKCYRAP
jgi:glycosyltransferase involved in cell wall biosynthesis